MDDRGSDRRDVGARKGVKSLPGLDKAPQIWWIDKKDILLKSMQVGTQSAAPPQNVSQQVIAAKACPHLPTNSRTLLCEL